MYSPQHWKQCLSRILAYSLPVIVKYPSFQSSFRSHEAHCQNLIDTHRVFLLAGNPMVVILSRNALKLSCFVLNRTVRKFGLSNWFCCKICGCSFLIFTKLGACTEILVRVSLTNKEENYVGFWLQKEQKQPGVLWVHPVEGLIHCYGPWDDAVAQFAYFCSSLVFFAYC